MTDVVLFADPTNITNNENSASPFKEVPTKSAGVYRIATEVRSRGLECVVVNYSFHFTLDEIETICKKLITSETKMVGLSTTFWYASSDHRTEILKTIYRHTRSYPNIKLVIGGTMSGYFAERIRADYSFDGYAESLFIKLIDCLINKTEFNIKPDKISSKGVAVYSHDNTSEFDFTKSKISYVDTDCLLPSESVTIETARGCIFRCKFCAYPLNGKKKFDYIKDPAVLKDELIENYEKYGTTNYIFGDDTFNDSTYKLEKFHKVIQELPFKLQFGSFIRLDLVNSHREQIQLLKEMGLISVFFGVETLSKAAGTKIGKSIDPMKAVNLLHDLKSTHWGDRVKIMVGLISGIPGETQETHDFTKKWILDEDFCLVDAVRPEPLGIANPLYDMSPFKSPFQLEAMKHGFYWTDKSNKWKNHSAWIKTWDNAFIKAKELREAAESTYRSKHGWSILNLQAWTNGQYSTDHFLNMPRKDFNIWFDKNLNNMITNFIKKYKEKFLGMI